MRSGGDGGSRATGGSGTRSESGGGRFGATGGGGYAVPRGERAAERASGNSGGGGSGSASSGGSTAERSPVSGAGYTDRAVRRGEGTGRVSERSPDGTDTGVPEYARPRNGKDPVGTAVPRGSVPSTGRVGGPLIISGGGYYGGYYDPWWYSPGYVGAYGGYYDPWYGGYPSYPQTTYSSYTDDGALRLKIKPRNAEVYVDGFFVGVVDDFDGIFQRLHLETGAHRIEVRAPGYEPLALDVRITPEHTTTYQGELKKIQ